jgi:DNA-binding transcriptional ArsR family regulator
VTIWLSNTGFAHRRIVGRAGVPAYYAGVIRVRMTVSDLARTRFAYSPLAEVGESLYALAAGSVYGLHRGWYDNVASRLGSVDMELLRAVVPPRPWIADFLFAGAVDATTSIEAQLELLCDMPYAEFAADLQSVWQGGPPPARASELLDPGGPRRLADVLFDYWTAAIEPHWPAMRAVLDEDVAYRAGELARGGAAAMLAGMHPELSIHGDMLSIAKKRAALDQETQLAGDGLLLVPSVFVWPNVVFAVDPARPPSLTYPARGVGNLWGRETLGLNEEDPLSALLGRSRAEILVALDLPSCTTDLAARLGQSPSAVSQHLSVLRRNGLVRSWRAGRRVLYVRTELATSIVGTSRAPGRGFAPDQIVVHSIARPSGRSQVTSLRP